MEGHTVVSGVLHGLSQVPRAYRSSFVRTDPLGASVIHLLVPAVEMVSFLAMNLWILRPIRQSARMNSLHMFVSL